MRCEFNAETRGAQWTEPFKLRTTWKQRVRLQHQPRHNQKNSHVLKDDLLGPGHGQTNVRSIPTMKNQNGRTAVRNTSKKVRMKSPTKARLNTITATDSVGTRKLREILQLDKTQPPRRDITETSAVEHEINSPSLN